MSALYVSQIAVLHSATRRMLNLICDIYRASANKALTVLVIIKLTKNPIPLRFRCGSSKLIFCCYFTNFVIFKNVVNSLEPGETPSYSASHQAPNYTCVQRS